MKHDKRTRLIQAADRLVYRQGLNETSLADIAKEADVPLGNVYYYFKTKDEIGAALIDQRASRYATLRQEWDDELSEPTARLEAFIQMTADNSKQLARSGCPIGSLCQELHKEGGPLAEQASAMFAEFLSWLEKQFRALGQGKQSADLAVHLLAALQGASLLTHSFGSPTLVQREAARLKAWVRAL